MGQALIGIAQGDLNAQMQYADALARLSTAGTEEAPRGRRKHRGDGGSTAGTEEAPSRDHRPEAGQIR